MSHKEKTNQPLPEFQSRQEVAEFWDTHDFTDYMDEFKPVKVGFAKNLFQSISMRLDPKTLTETRSRANDNGIGPITLARMWILEQLRELQGKARHTSQE